VGPTAASGLALRQRRDEIGDRKHAAIALAVQFKEQRRSGYARSSSAAVKDPDGSPTQLQLPHRSVLAHALVRGDPVGARRPGGRGGAARFRGGRNTGASDTQAFVSAAGLRCRHGSLALMRTPLARRCTSGVSCRIGTAGTGFGA